MEDGALFAAPQMNCILTTLFPLQGVVRHLWSKMFSFFVLVTTYRKAIESNDDLPSRCFHLLHLN